MEEQKQYLSLLEMMVQPVFCVKEGRIFRCNGAAKQLLLKEGDPVESLLEFGKEEYTTLEDGSLYLSVTIGGQRLPATVRRMDGMDLFELETDDTALQALALAASQLRRPLGTALAETAALLSDQEDPESRTHLSQLNHSLYRILRMLGSMSDADPSMAHSTMETTNASAFLQEVFEKAANLALRSGRHLEYHGLDESVFCLLDREQLERAVLNILANAMTFTPKDGLITASLTRRNLTLVLSIRDSGSGIPQDVMGSLFHRHLRKPGIEDGRYGLGLGIRLIHAAAVNHGGTLLIKQNPDGGTQVVMTLAIHQREANSFRSPVFSIDYTGGFDHSLVELADVLSADLYDGTY